MSEWSQAFDEGSGQYYYYNEIELFHFRDEEKLDQDRLHARAQPSREGRRSAHARARRAHQELLRRGD